MSSSDPTTFSAQVKRMSSNDQPTAETPPSELVAVVDDLLNQLSSKFNTVSSELIGKMDEMSKRLDALEADIQAGNAAGDGEGEK